MECLAMGDTWVHLGCALPHLRSCRLLRRLKESSRAQARGRTGHPIISSFEPREDWSWCFIDEIEVELPE